MADESEPWGLKKTAQVVIPISIVVFLAVYAFLPHDQAMKVSKAKGGECIMLPTANVVKNVKKVDCDRPHDGEIVAAFEYPGIVAAGQPTPEENCKRIPDGLTPEETALYQRVMAILEEAGYPDPLITNNVDSTRNRDYICVVSMPERTGAYLAEVLAAAQGTTTG